MAIISQSHKFIYVSGGKCATSSIHKYIESLSDVRQCDPARSIGEWKKYDKHMPAKIMIKVTGKEIWEEYFKFTFIRNPYSWVVSSFFFMVKLGAFKMPKNKIMTMKNFQETHRYYQTEQGRRFDDTIKVRSQSAFICDVNGKLMVDFVGRVENLESDWEYVCTKAKIPHKSLSTQNKSESSKNSYHIHYTDETKAFVERHWNNDIKMFNYRF